MSELVKIDLKISRKNVLLLSHFIEQGLLMERETSGLMETISDQGFSDLKNVSQECLQKAGLIELNEKLTALNTAIKL